MPRAQCLTVSKIANFAFCWPLLLFFQALGLKNPKETNGFANLIGLIRSGQSSFYNYLSLVLLLLLLLAVGM
ncbi:hypothetical protein BX661DRAFT_189758 [Kickxella alabastrina]|uniref:uncharacterized protein n=1 Tax=Kickxella alabastrina TaxID=61397 RepID=UPI00221EF801|nr:uncharacterized protein BX661DRAFT_189758 [Kickxella alabastrina]KAI7819755.1 hypothetical protein BX661DRAFT_189758 [Kickxella alabastrina]